ncbi:MAG: HesA/MoeB/ThiF family protein [Polyangiales bacterium]
MNDVPSVLMVGVGGLGTACAWLLASKLPCSLTIVDDDRVHPSNLHRQVLYSDADVGEKKIDVASRVLERLASESDIHFEINAVDGRVNPENVRSLLRGHDLVIEGTDNLPTKFLLADAARLENIPCVSAGCVRWYGWALFSASDGPCLRCLFEDIPFDRVQGCSEAGVVGPLVGLFGALQAKLVLDYFSGGNVRGQRWAYDARTNEPPRSTALRPRAGCALCEGEITAIVPSRYQPMAATEVLLNTH